MFGNMTIGSLAVARANAMTTHTAPIIDISKTAANLTGNGPTGPFYSIAGTSRTVEIHRGRATETDDFPAGTCAITIQNPVLKSAAAPSAMYTRLKVTAWMSGVLSTRFAGYIVHYDFAFDKSGNDSVLTIQCVDALGLLGQATLGPTWYVNEILDSAGGQPTVFWPLGEPSGSLIGYDYDPWSDGEYNLDYQNSPTLGGASLAVQGTNTSALFSGTALALLKLPVWPSNQGQTYKKRNGVAGDNLNLLDDAFGDHDLCFETLFSLPSSGGASKVLFWLDNGAYQCSYTNALIAYIDNTGNLYVNVIKNGVTDTLFNFNNPPGGWYDGAVHHLAINLFISGGPTRLDIYGDGVLLTPLSIAIVGSVGAWLHMRELSIGNEPQGTLPLTGSMQFFAIYEWTLTQAEITAHNQAKSYYYTTSDQAILRLLKLQPLWLDVTNKLDIDLDPGVSQVAVSGLAGNMLSVIKSFVASESGRLHCEANGALIHRSRYYGMQNYNVINTMMTLSDVASGSNVLYTELAAEYTDALVRSSVTLTRSGKTDLFSRATNNATGGGNDTRPFNVTLAARTTDDIAYGAKRTALLGHESPVVRIPSVEVITSAVSGASAGYGVITGRIIGDQVAFVKNGVTTVSTIQGIEETITPESWITRFHISPRTAWFIFDDPVYGVLNGTNQLSY